MAARGAVQEREMAAARKKRAHQVVAKALLKAVADLHPDAALEALAPFYARERNATRRRAIRAVRISLMRKALDAPPPVVSLPEPVVEPEPVPEVATEPPPPPKPAPKGKLLSMNLEEAAKLLMIAPEPEVAAAPAPAPAEAEQAEPEAAEASPEFQPMDWAAAAAGLAALDLPEEAEVAVADLPILMVAPAAAPVAGQTDDATAQGGPTSDPEGETPAKAKKKGGTAAKAAIPDLSAQFAAMSGDGLEALTNLPTGPKADALPAELDEELRALEGFEPVLEPVTPILSIDPAAAFAEMEAKEPPPAKAAVAQMVDPGAAFAAMDAAESPAPPAAKTPGKGMMADPAAAFAAMEAEEPPPVKAAMAQMVDPGAAFAAMDAAESPAPPAAKAPGKGMMADPAAAFAALEAAEDADARAAAPVAGKPKPLAIDLSAQFAAMSGNEDGKKAG
ncbi:hypothetical protein [Tabrizicola sp. TH137]|uniref:hypothetical protein n=1 Tax=Tabrizicola sp. TH137 TaxID=2067452 RepID=UPI00156DCFBB|nr:hypothetical protein [Tabrizicola sp. TH137]